MTSLLGDCTDPTSTSSSTTQPISNAMAIDALLSSISQIHHGSPGNVMGRSMMNNSVSTGLGTSSPGLLGPANMSDIGMCSLGSEESTLSESISILPPEEIASATSPSCVWSEDDSVARRAAPMAGVAWIIRDVPGVLSVSASPDRNAVLTAADAPFAMFLGTMTLRPEHRSDSEDDRDSDACDGPLSPRGDQTVTSWLYCAPLTCSSSVGLNPTSAPVPCVAWPSLALELQGVNRVLYVVPMTNEFRHAAFIDINGRCSRSYDSKSVRKIAQHISTALACLHEHGVFHGAIRPETVAVAVGARSAKMIFLPNMEQAVKEAGTDYFFTSPERRRCKSGPTAASDGWALGVTLYALLFGKVPFLTGRYEELLKLDFPSEGTSGKLRKWRPLLTALLLPDPEERLTPSDVSAGALNRLM